jgi:hypothetical protein
VMVRGEWVWWVMIIRAKVKMAPCGVFQTDLILLDLIIELYLFSSIHPPWNHLSTRYRWYWYTLLQT